MNPPESLAPESWKDVAIESPDASGPEPTLEDPQPTDSTLDEERDERNPLATEDAEDGVFDSLADRESPTGTSEYVTVSLAPSSAADAEPPDPEGPRIRAAGPQRVGAWSSEAERGGSRTWTVAAVVISILAVIVGGLVLARDRIVALAPGTAPVFAAVGLLSHSVGHGLEIFDVSSRRVEGDGSDALVVEGMVAAVDAGSHAVPSVRIALFDEGEEELKAVVVQPDRDTLESGETATFRARVDSPPPTARSIKVTFANLAAE